MPDKDIEDYSIHEIIWTMADYDVQYFKDTYVVTGHTLTQTIKDNLQPGYIYRRNNNIAIDCGASTISTFLSQWQMDFLNQISRISSMETINREAVQMTLSNITRKTITKLLFRGGVESGAGDSKNRYRTNENVSETERIKFARKYALSSMCKCGFCGTNLTRRSHHQDTQHKKPVWKCRTATNKGI